MVVLILTTKYDFSSDYVVAALRKIDCPYIRINSEDFPSKQVSLDPLNQILILREDGKEKVISNQDIRSIYYRRPVFYREFGLSQLSPEKILSRAHWLSFLGNLQLMDSVRWVNTPASIYLAEHKAFQLTTAKRTGLRIPKTIITNDFKLLHDKFPNAEMLIIKGLDTVILRKDETESFGFTHVVKKNQLVDENLASIPTIFQEYLEPKLDIRVTVIGNTVFAAEVTKSGKGISGDWRAHKSSLEYKYHSLPRHVSDLCVRLLQNLCLSYGAIDLALHNGHYYFLEVNPTGEWAWLVKSAGLRIDIAIAEFLSSPERTQA